jgi:4-carboxymuconolactone decarboxylase
MLAPRQRIAVTISTLYTLHRRKDIGRQLRSARRLRIPRSFLEELFVHYSLVLGVPAMLDGLEQLQVEWPRGLSKRRRDTSSKKGIHLLRRIYGEQTEKLLLNLDRLHPEASEWIVRDVYGKVFTRQGMTLRERELVTITVLSLQGLERQLYSHLRGALRLRVSHSTLVEVISLVERISRKQQRGARSVLSQVVSQRKMSYF